MRWRHCPVSTKYTIEADGTELPRWRRGSLSGLPEYAAEMSGAIVTQPDLTLLLDLDVELGLARKGKQDEWNRLDAYTLEFHRRVRAGYHELIALEPGRWVVVDAGQDWGSVQASLRKVIGERLK